MRKGTNNFRNSTIIEGKIIQNELFRLYVIYLAVYSLIRIFALDFV